MKKCFILLIFLICSCGTCNDLDIIDFKRQMTLITRVKDQIIDTKTFKSSNSLSKIEVKALINEKDYAVLKKLDFDGIGKLQNVIIFRFQYKDESNTIVKKVDKKLDMDYQFTSSHFLFYSTDKELREKISYYERYSECRNDYENIGNDWTYVKRVFPCAD